MDFFEAFDGLLRRVFRSVVTFWDSDPITNDVLGTLDPTLLDNGLYEGRCSGENHSRAGSLRSGMIKRMLNAMIAAPVQ
jgi:hypothetical protein